MAGDASLDISLGATNTEHHDGRTTWAVCRTSAEAETLQARLEYRDLGQGRPNYRDLRRDLGSSRPESHGADRPFLALAKGNTLPT